MTVFTQSYADLIERQINKDAERYVERCAIRVDSRELVDALLGAGAATALSAADKFLPRDRPLEYPFEADFAVNGNSFTVEGAIGNVNPSFLLPRVRLTTAKVADHGYFADHLEATLGVVRAWGAAARTFRMCNKFFTDGAQLAHYLPWVKPLVESELLSEPSAFRSAEKLTTKMQAIKTLSCAGFEGVSVGHPAVTQYDSNALYARAAAFAMRYNKKNVINLLSGVKPKAMVSFTPAQRAVREAPMGLYTLLSLMPEPPDQDGSVSTINFTNIPKIYVDDDALSEDPRFKYATW